MSEDEDKCGINSLKFPRYSGWLYLHENVLIPTRYWCVLSNGYLHYYKDWRQNFYTKKIPLKGVSIDGKGWPLYYQKFRVGDLEWSTSDFSQGKQWLFYLKNSAIDGSENIEAAVDSCRNLIVETRLRSDYPSLYLRLLGVMTISKDATTSKRELFELSEYLSTKRFGHVLSMLYKLVYEELKITCVTNDMLEQCSQKDDTDDGWKLIYLIRRLLWRFAYASKRFALQITETCYINYLLSDLRNLTETPFSTWNDGNYLLFSSLNCLQQCARTNRMKTAFYKANAHTIIGNIRQRSDSKKIKMATFLTLSHILHEEDYHLLKIDEDFMTYFLDLIKKAIANGSRFVNICSKVGHLTEIREMFDAFSKVYRLRENQEVIARMKKEDLALQVLEVLKKSDLDEKLFTLQMMKSMCTFKVGKMIFQNQYYDDVISEVSILSKHDDLHVRRQAEIVYEYLKIKGDWKKPSRHGTEPEKLYLQALTEGSTLDRTIRVMFVGHKGAGKTTLCKRFLGENITSIRSTEGIDVYIEKFIVDLETKKWTIDVEGDSIENSRIKIASGVKHFEDLNNLKSTSEENKPCIFAIDNADGMSENFHDGCDNKNIDHGNGTKNEITPLERKYSTTEDGHKTCKSKVIEENIKINFEIEANVTIPVNAAHLSMWDFAGEEVFYATHHVFLSPDALYLIVIDLSNTETNNVAEIEKARFWLRSILTYAKIRDEDESSGFRLPPVIFVVTHKDKLTGKTEEEKREVAHSYLADVLTLQELQGIDSSFIRGKFVIDNTFLFYDPEIDKLKDCIVDSAQNQPNWEKEIPLQWLAVEREMSLLKSQKVKIITIEELRDYLRNCEVSELTLHNIAGVLEHFHLKGFIMFFSGSENLRNYVFVDPQWIVNAFKQLITIPSGHERFENHIIRSKWKLLHEDGKLTADFAKEIFKVCGDKQLVYNGERVLQSMEELNLIAKMPSYWIVPSLLKRQLYTTLLASFFKDSNNSIHKSCAYCLKFREAFVPDPIMDKVVAACVSKWTDIYHLGGRPILYRGLVCLRVTTSCCAVIYCKDNMIQAMLFRTENESQESFGEVGNSVRLFLYDCIEEIFKTFHQESMKPLEYIQCEIIEPQDSMPVLADDIFKHDIKYCCSQRTLTPHPLTHHNLRQWWKKVEIYKPHFKDLELDLFSTPPESPDPYDDISSFPFIEKDKAMKHSENRFKRFVDSTLTVDVWENLQKCSQSVGCLHSPLQISTVFRVGNASVLSAAHHVLEIIACPGRCSEFSAHDESRLLDENVYIEFKGKIKESNKLFSLRKIQYIDVVRDVCVLELMVFDYCNLPPPFTEFCHPTTDSSLTFIGYGHPSHNLKTIEPKVRVLNLQSKRVENSIAWIQNNRVQLKNVLQFTGKPVEWVDDAYSILQNEGIVGLNCFMQHGASGAPGIAMTTHGLALAVMLQGGLPKFFMDIGYFAEQIPLEQRIEYGITVDTIRQALLQEAPELCQNIFGPKMFGF